MKKIILLTVLLTLVSISTASAQLFLEQAKLKLNIHPSENINQSVTLHNTTNQPTKIRVLWQDFEYTGPLDGAKKFMAPGSVKNSAGSWVNFSPREFVLQPFGKQDVSIVINTPPVVHGGYYGVLFFEKEPEENKGMKGINIVTRIGCLMFLESVDKVKKGDLENITIEASRLKSEFVDQGDIVLIPKGVYYILDQDGNAIDRGEMINVYLSPQQKAPYTFEFSHDLKPGSYTLVMTLDLDEGDTLVKEVDFKKISESEFQVVAIR